jgi:hypothetical protein
MTLDDSSDSAVAFATKGNQVSSAIHDGFHRQFIMAFTACVSVLSVLMVAE